jgi:ureidoacrylate peracid hydrolase
MPHNVKIPDYVIGRIMAKRGRLEVFDKFDPKRTALLIVDMQNFYVEEVETARSIVPNINRLASACRAKGVPVFWVIMTVADREGGESRWPIYHNHFFTPAKGANHRNMLSEGAHGHKIFAELNVDPGDVIVRKSRFSPFIAGASDLHERLRARGVENLFVCGTATNMCCESTARDAMMLDYKAVMVEDANAARFDDDHLAGLISFYQSFGDVRSTDAAIGMLE